MVAIDPLQSVFEEVKPEVFDLYLMYLYLLYVEDALLGMYMNIIYIYIYICACCSLFVIFVDAGPIFEAVTGRI